jgi:hypothetical protein
MTLADFIAVAAVTPQDDGAFEIAGVPPGRYILRAPGYGNADLYVANIDVSNLEFSTIEISPFNVALNPKAKRSVEILISLDGIDDPRAGAIPKFDVVFTPTNRGLSTTPQTVPVSGREFSAALPDGEYQVSLAGLPNGYTLVSITSGPLGSPFLITDKGIADPFTGRPVAPPPGGRITIRLDTNDSSPK